MAIFGLGSGNALNPRFRRLKRNIQTSEYCLESFLFPDSYVWIYGFRRLNWFIWNQKGNRLKSAYFRRLKHLIQTSELCSGNLYISRFRRLNHLFQTSESAVFCLLAYSLENSNLNRFVMILFVVIIYYAFDDSYLGIFEYPFRWILYRFLWILFTSSNVNFSDWLFLQYSLWFVTLKILRFSILVVNIKTLSSNDLNTILIPNSFIKPFFNLLVYTNLYLTRMRNLIKRLSKTSGMKRLRLLRRLILGLVRLNLLWKFSSGDLQFVRKYLS